MKHPISWYERNLKNATRYYNQREAIVRQILDEIEKGRKELQFQQRQIDEAKRRGMDSFDLVRVQTGRFRPFSDRYLHEVLEVLEMLLHDLFGKAITADQKARLRTLKDLDQSAAVLAEAVICYWIRPSHHERQN